MVVICHRASAGGCHSVQLVIWKAAPEKPTGSAACAIKLIIRIIHLINTEDSLHTTFVKRAVVRHQRQSLYQRLHMSPHFREHGRVIGVGVRKSVHALAEPGIIIRLRLDKTVKSVGYDSVAHNNNSNTANAAALTVCCLKVYCGKVFHHKNLIRRKNRKKKSKTRHRTEKFKNVIFMLQKKFRDLLNDGYEVNQIIKNIGWNGNFYTSPYFLAFLLKRFLKEKM